MRIPFDLKYNTIVNGSFVRRLNRFTAVIRIGDVEELVHVKNTGRLSELLLPDAQVYLFPSEQPGRKTKYDLVGVNHHTGVINIDSQAPNAAVKAWLKRGGLGFVPELVRPEYTLGDSRFDFYFETGKEKHILEVKGVTLFIGDTAVFPDAPTLRGRKHVEELTDLQASGYHTHLLFVIQSDCVSRMTTNTVTDPSFCRAVSTAVAGGVDVRAVLSQVTPNSMTITDFIPVIPSDSKEKII